MKLVWFWVPLIANDGLGGEEELLLLDGSNIDAISLYLSFCVQKKYM